MGVTVTASQSARNSALAGVARAHQPDMERVCAAILALAEERDEFTADDVFANMLADPPPPAVVGTAFALLLRRKRIEKTGRLAYSTRTNQHAATLICWRKAGATTDGQEGRIEQAARRAAPCSRAAIRAAHWPCWTPRSEVRVTAEPTTVKSTEWQRAPGAMADRVVGGETVIVERNHRPILVMLPMREYVRLCDAASMYEDFVRQPEPGSRFAEPAFGGGEWSLRDLADLALRTLAAQQTYFKTRSRDDLIASKQLEAELKRAATEALAVVRGEGATS